MAIDLKKAREVFETYLDEYDRNDEKIKLKIVQMCIRDSSYGESCGREKIGTVFSPRHFSHRYRPDSICRSKVLYGRYRFHVRG